jgi:universal stress protein A
MFKRILWATDFSEHATPAREWAVHCAKCSQGKLFALVVVDASDLPVLSALGSPEVGPEELRRAEAWTEAELAEVAKARLESELEDIRAADVRAEGLVRIGSPWREIVNAAEELSINMIVLGSHGKHAIKTILLGNTVENVTKHAPCPVMIIR